MRIDNTEMTSELSPVITDEKYRKALSLPEDVCESYVKLAQGEYNVNYLFTHPVTKQELILRINMGSQMHLERQIEYEAHALGLLAETGRTPKVFYADGSKRLIENGYLVMEYLPGDYPHYSNADDMKAVMECLADIHSLSIPEDEVIFDEPNLVPRDTLRLIAPSDSSLAILDECESMLAVYTGSMLGDESVKKRLRRLFDRGYEIAEQSASCPAENAGAGRKNPAYRCCINTELNSTNFLVNKGYARLVDWEKPLYGDPAQDLGHLLAPTTTFWKTDDILTDDACDFLLDEYIKAVCGRFDTEGIKRRTRRLITITCLRGLSWCAMAWVQYKDPKKAIVNESTRKKIDAYLEDDFLSDIEKRFGIQSTSLAD